MANINIENISDLNLNGNDLFEDSENFMTELSDDSEQANIIGGFQWKQAACVNPSCAKTEVANPGTGLPVIVRSGRG